MIEGVNAHKWVISVQDSYFYLPRIENVKANEIHVRSVGYIDFEMNIKKA